MLIRKYFKLEQQGQASESNSFYTFLERICGILGLADTHYHYLQIL